MGIQQQFLVLVIHTYIMYPGSWSSCLFLQPSPCKNPVGAMIPASINRRMGRNQARNFLSVLCSGRTPTPTIIFDRHWRLASTSGFKPPNIRQIKPRKQGLISSPHLSFIYSLPPVLFSVANRLSLIQLRGLRTL